MSCPPSESSSSQLRKRGGSPLKSKLRTIRKSKRKQKQLQQTLIVIAAVLIAFALGFFFFGPSFSSGE